MRNNKNFKYDYNEDNVNSIIKKLLSFLTIKKTDYVSLLRVNNTNGNVCLVYKNRNDSKYIPHYKISDEFVQFIDKKTLNSIKKKYCLSNQYSLNYCNEKYTYYHLADM